MLVQTLYRVNQPPSHHQTTLAGDEPGSLSDLRLRYIWSLGVNNKLRMIGMLIVPYLRLFHRQDTDIDDPGVW